MKDENKAPAQIGESEPKPETREENKNIGKPEVSERDRVRLEAEQKIVGEPAPLPPETKEQPKEEQPKEEPQEPREDDEERLKAKIQKRIGKEVAKRKTLEEQLSEKDSEIERLKAGKPAEKKEDREPTLDEIAVALKKAREEGDVKFEVEILDYIAERKAKKERAEAEKQFEERNTQVTERQRKWAEIVQDYTVFDEENREVKEHPLNLANAQSQLYKTANALYLDPELKKHRYSQGTEMENLRRAISDAYIELTKIGVEKKEAKTSIEGKTPKERMKGSLVEPSAAREQAPEQGAVKKPMSDQDKVLDEVKHRVNWKREREAALI